jgi:hypothetical protein
MFIKLNECTIFKSLIIIFIALTNVAQAQNTPLYKDKNGLFDRRNDFMSLGQSIGYLENTKFLKEREQQSLKDLQNKVASIKQKYKSETMDEMWKNFYDLKYQEAAERVKVTDRKIEMDLNNRDTTDGSPFLSDPYSCTTFQENRKTGEKNYDSTYVLNININIKSARKNIHSLENYLSKPKNSGMMMLTQADYYKIEGESVFCIPRDGSTNPAVAKEAAARENAINVKKRIPPYSQSRTPQHEMVCQSLDDSRIPPPFGAKCLFNYK